jgi:hypothetical protein
VITNLNRAAILIGAGTGLVVGIILEFIAGGADAGTGVQMVIQFLAFLVAGVVAGRLSLGGALAAGGFAALLQYFGLALVAIISGNELHPVAILVFGFLALVFGSAGAALGTVLRKS